MFLRARHEHSKAHYLPRGATLPDSTERKRCYSGSRTANKRCGATTMKNCPVTMVTHVCLQPGLEKQWRQKELDRPIVGLTSGRGAHPWPIAGRDLIRVVLDPLRSVQNPNLPHLTSTNRFIEFIHQWGALAGNGTPVKIAICLSNV